MAFGAVARSIALHQSTEDTTPTLWPDERPNVPPIRESDRAYYQKWLDSSGFLPASDAQKWEAICRTWISFLSATSSMPKLALAPLRKVITFENPEPPERLAQRFERDFQERRLIQGAMWRLFDELECFSERWPTEARIIVNQLGSTSETSAFESWAAKVNLRKRRRANSIWSSLICFLVYALDEEALEGMGLELSEEMDDTIFSLNYPTAFIPRFEKTVCGILSAIVSEPNPTFRSNPLLWWVGVLVHSSLQVGADDYISRGRFVSNILPMDVDIQARLESLLHYSKVLVIDITMETWEPNADRRFEVVGSMNNVDNNWINADDDQRPAAGTDNQDCSTVAWQDMLEHLREQCKEFLGEQRRSAAGQIRLLLRQRGQHELNRA